MPPPAGAARIRSAVATGTPPAAIAGARRPDWPRPHRPARRSRTVPDWPPGRRRRVVHADCSGRQPLYRPVPVLTVRSAAPVRAHRRARRAGARHRPAGPSTAPPRAPDRRDASRRRRRRACCPVASPHSGSALARWRPRARHSPPACALRRARRPAPATPRHPVAAVSPPPRCPCRGPRQRRRRRPAHRLRRRGRLRCGRPDAAAPVAGTGAHQGRACRPARASPRHCRAARSSCPARSPAWSGRPAQRPMRWPWRPARGAAAAVPPGCSAVRCGAHRHRPCRCSAAAG